MQENPKLSRLAIKIYQTGEGSLSDFFGSDTNCNPMQRAWEKIALPVYPPERAFWTQTSIRKGSTTAIPIATVFVNMTRSHRPEKPCSGNYQETEERAVCGRSIRAQKNQGITLKKECSRERTPPATLFLQELQSAILRVLSEGKDLGTENGEIKSQTPPIANPYLQIPCTKGLGSYGKFSSLILVFRNRGTRERTFPKLFRTR